MILYGVCIEPPCLLMELMDTSLFHHLKKNGVPDWKSTIAIALDIARGMAYLHNQRKKFLEFILLEIIHGDMKSLNILLDKHLQAKVSDFGLSRYNQISATSSTSHVAQVAVGFTVPYAAPEVLNGSKLCWQGDVYAFGVVLWELMTAKIPYLDDKLSLLDIKSGVCKGTVRPILPLNANSTFKELTKKCWAQSTKDRPPFLVIIEVLEKL